jgi:predicted acyl esterase
MRFPAILVCIALLAAAAVGPALADAPAGKDAGFNDIPKAFKQKPAPKDYVRRVEMIPMRDGVKLFTVIWIPNGAHDAPIVLTPTPYHAAHHVRDIQSASLLTALPL